MNSSNQPEQTQRFQQQAPRSQSGLAVTSLVLGILSMLGGGITIILPLVAVILGILAIRACGKNSLLNGKGLAIAGLIMGGLSGLGGLAVILLTSSAILFPALEKVGETSKRSVASSNLRQIGQASLIYATDNNDQLPPETVIINGVRKSGMEGVMLALADGGGLNDASVWFAGSDAAKNKDLSTVNAGSGDGRTKLQSPELVNHSYCYVVGLSAIDASTTPIAWTRGLQKDGTWSKDSPWNGEGGHVVFLGGNVQWYNNINNANPLIDTKGNGTSNYENAIPKRKGVRIIIPKAFGTPVNEAQAQPKTKTNAPTASPQKHEDKLTVKGLSMGMNLNSATEIIKKLLIGYDTNGRLLKVTESKTANGSIEARIEIDIGPVNKEDQASLQKSFLLGLLSLASAVVIEADQNRNLTKIQFPATAVDHIFGSSEMDAREFAQHFVNAYPIQQLTVLKNGEGWYAVTKDGTRVTITTEKELALQKVLSTAEQKNKFN